VTLNSNGYVTGFAQNNDGTTGTFKILADKFTIIDPSDSAGESGTQVFDIENGVVTMGSAHIGNLSIGTAKITDQAVYTQETASLVTAIGISPADNYVDLISKSITLSDLSTSSAVIIHGLIQATNTYGSWQYFSYRLYRDTTLLKEYEATVLADQVNNETAGVSILFVDAPTNGTYTYKLQGTVNSNSTSTVDRMWVDTAIISVGAAKR
jgi:hypothetical protein